MPGTAQRSPKKEKSKLPQVSCSVARPPRSPCHRAGVTAWSPPRWRRSHRRVWHPSAPSAAAARGARPDGATHGTSPPGLLSGFSSSFSVRNSRLCFHLQQEADSLGLLFSDLGCPDLQGGRGTGRLQHPPTPEPRGCQRGALSPYPTSTHPGITASPSVQTPPALFTPFPLTPTGLWSCGEQESDGCRMLGKADRRAPPPRSTSVAPHRASLGPNAPGDRALRCPASPSPAPKDTASHRPSPPTARSPCN